VTDKKEEQLKAQIEAQNASVQAQNARVKAWIERTKDIPMSIREDYDGRAEVMRPSTVEMLERMTRLGWIHSQDERAKAMQSAFTECGFDLFPKSGWPAFCYELDLIFVAMPDRTDDRNLGHAALEPERKVVERYQWFVIHRRCRDDRRSTWPGLIPPVGNICAMGLGFQAICGMGNGR
jgi:hypothetical protein